MLRGLSSVFSFLTIMPVSNSGLETVARHMHLFPLVGIALGLLVGGLGFGMSMFLDPLVVSLLVVISITILTGLHHVDGLADFADGLMARGSKERKLAAMKDLSTGSAGIVTMVLYMVGLVVAFSLSAGYELFLAILFGEIMAKFSMVLMASISQSASPGSNTPFVEVMRDRRKLLFAGAMTLAPIVVLGGAAGMAVFAAGMIVAMFISGIATRSFGGITGDVLGATNEVTRLASVMAFVSL